MKTILKNYLQEVSQRSRARNLANSVVNLLVITFFLTIGITKGYLDHVLVLSLVILGCSIIFAKVWIALYYVIRKAG